MNRQRGWVLWVEAWHDGQELFQPGFLSVTLLEETMKRWQRMISKIEEDDEFLEGVYLITEVKTDLEFSSLEELKNAETD